MSRPAYRRPQGGNAFQQFAGSGREVHPLEVDYKKLKIGGRIRLRFLDLTPEAAAVLEAREVGIVNKQNNSMMAIKVEIPGEYVRNEDGSYDFTVDERVKSLVDHNGTPVLACKSVKIYRAPVWVYYEQDENGKITDIDALRFIEFTQGLRDSMDELVGFQNGAGAFNEETGRPDYDVDLCIIKGEGSIPKNYKFEVVFLDEKTKKQHENFGSEAEEVLESVLPEIEQMWPEVIEAAFRQTTYEDLEKRLAPAKESRQAVSGRPGMGRVSNEPTAPEAGAQETSASPRPTGRRYGNRG